MSGPGDMNPTDSGFAGDSGVLDTHAFEFGLHALSSRRAGEGRRLGVPVVYREELDSTNAHAAHLADSGATHGTLVVAGRQTAGRGRRGRTWESPEGGNLYLSLILRPKLTASRAFEFTLLSAVALAEALEACGVETSIKWPNDVEIDGLKVAGILSELATNPDGSIRWVILGIGVNVNVSPDAFPPEVRTRATSLLASCGRRFSLVSVVEALLDRLEYWVARHATDGFSPVLERWRERTSTLGAPVRAQVDGRVIEGIAEDLDDTGALLVRVDGGAIERIVAGEVVTLRKQ